MRHGFSLVELSIVLVILGLLTGGILAGRSLIRASELRSVTTQYQQFVTAGRSFRDKYFAIPGDFNAATKFWGAEAVCPGTNASPSTSALTCNGDGDGILEQTVASPQGNEFFRLWQHLSNAGLVEGSYTGVADSASGTSSISTPGLNGPASRIGTAGWTALYFAPVAISSTVYFEGEYGNFLVVGAPYVGGGTRTPFIRPEDAWNIDTKLDDGKPALGKVVSHEAQAIASSSGCSTPAASAAVTLTDSEYSLTNSGINCALNFRQAF
jgi:prepilin-type N-terminal cleavage/methylation domain-containing protein